MFADPQVRHRGLAQYASDAELAEVPHIRTPVRIGEGVRVRNVVPKLGQNNAEIFGRLGVSKAELKELDEKGAVGRPSGLLFIWLMLSGSTRLGRSALHIAGTGAWGSCPGRAALFLRCADAHGQVAAINLLLRLHSQHFQIFE
jgi:hypothetical protein